MLKRLVLFFLFIFNLISLFPQTGRGVYRFLDLPVSSRMAAIGGMNVSLRDNDVNFAFMNPALLTGETHGVIGLNMANYLADIKFGSAVYGHNFGENNFTSFGVQYVDLGKFEGYDELGNFTEDFTAKDIALYMSYARRLDDYFTVGATFKPIFSSYERYTSFGIAFDAGINYSRDLFSAGLVFRNMGAQLKAYYPDEQGQHREPLPFDIQLGVSKKFAHAPIRISGTLNNLNRWNVAGYQTDKTTTNLDGTTEEKKVKPVDMAFRHVVLGVELVPSDNFYIALGYNHRRNQEMTMEGFKSLAGFSAGAGLKLYKFHVGFGLTQFQVGNFAYQFSFSTDLNDFVSF
ncbi:MAG: type IX secretion system protein PorQ [Bacteroidia bacterium]|nr:type IX secretion system protein PorQ [Bacteroidia bacterium]HRG03396.1 type IX secretion system protein PorQ [Paludibacteraceae bacterium]